jgi:hypothetical protein
MSQINEHTKITKYGLGHPGSGLRQTQKCIAGKWLIGSQSLSRSMDLQRHYGKKSHTSLMQYEKQIITGEVNLLWIFSRNDVGDPLT